MFDGIFQWLDWLSEEHETAYAVLVIAVLFTLFAVGSSIEFW